MNQREMPYRRRALIECLILVAIAAALRIWHIGKTDLGYDESFSLYMSLQSLPDAIRMLCKGDNPRLRRSLVGRTLLFKAVKKKKEE